MAERIDPTNGKPLTPAAAALHVLERRPHRTALAYLFDHPDATRRDITDGTGLSNPAVSTALADLVTLRYVAVDEGTGEHGHPDHFTAHRPDFVSDLTALRDLYGRGEDERKRA